MHHDNSNAPLNDEIDLVEMARALWSQRLLILAITSVVSFGAAGYAFLTKPVYESQVSILPPNPSDIAGYNVGRSPVTGLKPFSVDEVYGYFVRSLSSEALRRSFFLDVYLPAVASDRKAPTDLYWKQFNQDITVKSDKQRPERRQVQVSFSDPRVAADWANAYVLRAASETERMMERNVSAEVAIQAQDLERQIETLRETARQRREDRVAALEEALKVAIDVGLENAQGTVWQNVTTSATTASDSTPLYLRGSKALRAELAVLKGRTSDDPFIPELRSLQERLGFLKSVDISPEQVAVYTLDSAALVPEVPVKPKKALIVALGVVLGGMLGMFAALIRTMWLRSGSRESKAEAFDAIAAPPTKSALPS